LAKRAAVDMAAREIAEYDEEQVFEMMREKLGV